MDRPSCSETRRFRSGSIQVPNTSGSSVTPDVTDRTRHARTKAFVNGDCIVKEKIHKCPSAPCISQLEGKSYIDLKFPLKIKTDSVTPKKRNAKSMNYGK